MPATPGPDFAPPSSHSDALTKRLGQEGSPRLDQSGISHPSPLMTPLPAAGAPHPNAHLQTQANQASHSSPHGQNQLSISQSGQLRVSHSALPAHMLETSKVFTPPSAPLPSGWTAAPPHPGTIPFAAEESVLTLPIRHTGGQAARSAVIASLAVCGAVALGGSLWAAHNMKSSDPSASAIPSAEFPRSLPQPLATPPVETSKPTASSPSASVSPSASSPPTGPPGGIKRGSGPYFLPGGPGSKNH